MSTSSTYYQPFGVLSDPYYSNPANNPMLGNFGSWPGTAASNMGESYNPSIGNFTTSPTTNRMLDNVNYMSSWLMGPNQTENGVAPQYPGDSMWNQFTANDPFATYAGGGVPSSTGPASPDLAGFGTGVGAGSSAASGPNFAGRTTHPNHKLYLIG